MENKFIWYDDAEDILGIRVSDGDYWKSVELPQGTIIDISKEGVILGFEIFNASKIFSGANSKVLESAIKQTKNTIK